MVGAAGARLSMITPLSVVEKALLLPTASYATRRKLQLAHSSAGAGTQEIDEYGPDDFVLLTVNAPVPRCTSRSRWPMPELASLAAGERLNVAEPDSLWLGGIVGVVAGLPKTGVAGATLSTTTS